MSGGRIRTNKPGGRTAGEPKETAHPDESLCGRDSEEILKSYLDTRTDAITILSPVKHPGTDRIVGFITEYANAASKRLLAVIRPGGCSDASIPGLPCGEPARELLDRYIAVFETGVPDETEHPCNIDDKDVWFHATVERLGAHLVLTVRRVNERKRLESKHAETAAALRESEERYRLSFQLSAVGLAEIDPMTLRYLRVNRKFCEITGFTENELLKCTISDITHPDDLLEELRLTRRYFASVRRTEYVSRKRIVRKDREIRHVEVHARLLADGRGKAIRSIATVLDITERIRAEQAVQESETRFRSLADSMPQLVWTANADGMIEYYNRRLKEYCGSASGITVGWNWIPVIYEDDVDRTETAWSASVLRGASFQIEHRLQMKDGTYRWHLSRAVPIPNEHGEMKKWYGTSTDIHAQKLLSERLLVALQDSEHSAAGLETAFNSAPIGLAVNGRDGRLLRLNELARQVTPYTQCELRSRQRGEASESTGGAIVFEDTPLGKALRGESVPRYELKYREENGTERLIECGSAPIRLQDGRILGAITSFRDVTAERTLENDLRLAKEAAESANRAKTEFLAHMSHELRTPLTGIIGMAEILLSRVNDSHRQYVELIREASHSLVSIIGDILDLSKIEAGGVELRPRIFDLHRTVRELVESMNVTARAKGISLVCAVETGVPDRVRSDDNALKQILRNLLSNAIKYTDRGGVELRVTAIESTPTRLVLRFDVKDSGIGIPQGQFDRLFQPFSRLHDTVLRRTYEGTGLGLAISQRLADLLGGGISVKSVPGEGSIFSLTVPLGSVGNEPEWNGEVRENRNAASALPPLEILVAEDNELNLLYLRTILQDAGHTVHAAHNGREAVDLHRALSSGTGRPIDLILMDIQMPVMGGIEATKLIRDSESARTRVPIIALTAFAMVGDRERFQSAGLDGYVTKPVDLGKLTEEIRTVCGLDRERR